MAQALSHFSWQYTKGYLMIVDVQGCDSVLTDPQIHCLDKRKFGSGNLGYYGIIKFFLSHFCNDYCRALNLIDPKFYSEIPKEFSFFIDSYEQPGYKQFSVICEICHLKCQTNSHSYYENRLKFPEIYCKYCIKRISEKIKEATCSDCKNIFSFSSYWYFEKRMDPPYKCSKCRNLNKQETLNQANLKKPEEFSKYDDDEEEEEKIDNHQPNTNKKNL